MFKKIQKLGMCVVNVIFPGSDLPLEGYGLRFGVFSGLMKWLDDRDERLRKEEYEEKLKEWLK